MRRRTRSSDPAQLPAGAGLVPDGHRIKATLDYGRGPEKPGCTGRWAEGRPRTDDDRILPYSVAYQRFLQIMERDNPDGQIVVVTDNLPSHHSVATRTWLEDHPRIRQVFIPVGACWLNLQEG